MIGQPGLGEPRLPCLLLPGFDGSGRLFDPLLKLPELPFEPHVVALPADLPRGYDDLVGWLEPQLPAKPFVLLAESFSGPLAIRLAARNPGRVTHLVLAATFLRAPLQPWFAPLGPLARPVLFSRPPPVIAIRALLAGWDSPAELVGAIRTAMAELPPEVAAARARAALAADESVTFARISAPTLWIRAGDDRLLRAGHADEARAARPSVQIARVGGAHTILQRRPGACLESIAGFLQR
jgi:pimeloyl-ACP methyl ester carboxylesterase